MEIAVEQPPAESEQDPEVSKHSCALGAGPFGLPGEIAGVPAAQAVDRGQDSRETVADTVRCRARRGIEQDQAQARRRPLSAPPVDAVLERFSVSGHRVAPETE